VIFEGAADVTLIKHDCVLMQRKSSGGSCVTLLLSKLCQERGE